MTIGRRTLAPEFLQNYYVKLIGGEFYAWQGKTHKFKLRIAEGHINRSHYSYRVNWGDGGAADYVKI